MKLISRKEAKAQGLTRYFTGKPCPQGHIAEHRVVNWGCIACEKERTKEYQKEKPELWRRGARDWGKKNKACKATNVALWKIKNPEQQKAINKKAHRAYANRHPLRVKVASSKRRRRKREAEGNYTYQDIEALALKQHNTCLCGVSFDFEPFTIDHIVALARGGSNNPVNLQLLCQPCNDSKGVLSMDEWTPRWAANLEAIGDENYG